MDALTKLRILAGLKVDDAEYIKGLIAEDVTKDISGPIKEGGKHLFYLVTNATPNSTMGDVISEVDTRAFAQIAVGAGIKAVHQEKWELFPHHLQKEALELAKQRLEAAKKAATVEGVEYEEETKQVPVTSLNAIKQIIRKLKDMGEEAYQNKDEDMEDMYNKDFAAYTSIYRHLKKNEIQPARKLFKHMDTAARDYAFDKKYVPSLAMRKDLAELFGVELLHEYQEQDMKKTKMFYLDRAQAAIDADEDIIYDVASNLGQNLDNVKHMAWFKKQVATWIAHDRGDNFEDLVKESEEIKDEPMVSYAHKDEPKGKRFRQYKKDKLPVWATDVIDEPCNTKPVTEAKNDKAQDAMVGAPEKIGKIDASPVAKNTSNDVKKASVKDTKNDDVTKASTDKAEKVETLPDKADLVNEPMTSDEMTSGAGSDDKVKVPASVMKSLTDKVAELRKQSKTSEQVNADLAQYYDATATIFDEMATALKSGECSPSMLALYVNKFATPTVQELPKDVWNFLINGGKIRSLADHFKDVKEKKKEMK